MTDIAKLEKELMEKNKWLFIKLTEQESKIRDSAQAEHNYRVALAIKMLELRTEGTPATIMSDLCRGNKGIAKLKLERDIAKGIADACNQAIRAIQSSMNAFQTMISYGKAEMNLR